MSKKNPVLVWMSVLAGMQMFLGGATTVAIIAESYLFAQLVALAMLAVGAAQGGIQFYVRGQVVPVDDVLEYQTSGAVIAGPANDRVPANSEVRKLGGFELPLTEQDAPA